MNKKGIGHGLKLLLAVLALSLLFVTPVSAKSKPTKYNGTNYARVYNYDYYMNWLKTARPSTYKKLKKKSGAYVLKYFVKTGMGKKDRGNAAFDVQSYYNQKPGLRYSYGQSWAKYYTYFVKHSSETVTYTPSLTSYITSYYYNKTWVDLSSIYDFKYFTNNYSAANKYWKNQDDAGAVKYFVETAMYSRVSGKAGVSGTSDDYNTLYAKLHPTTKAELEADKKAQNYTSKTNYLILLNRTKYRVYIYKGSKGNWTRIKTWKCGVGASRTPTPLGTYKIGGKGRYFTHGSIRCWYFSQITGSILFHSKLYHTASKPIKLYPGSQYGRVSAGCVRLDLQNAYYIYKHIPKKTKVVIYK